MYHLAEFGPGHSAVIRSADGATIPDDPDNTDRQAYVEWVAAGNAPAEVAATLPQTIASAAARIQGHIDNAARLRGYADGVALASYVSSTNPSWAAEAETFVAWRDAVWGAAYTALADIRSGARPMPAQEALIAELPPITW